MTNSSQKNTLTKHLENSRALGFTNEIIVQALMDGLQLQLKTYMLLKDVRTPIDWLQTAAKLVDQVSRPFALPDNRTQMRLYS